MPSPAEPERVTGDAPTVNDIARVAGVSLATVDRVLNGRPGVRTVTIEKVRTAIDELGYVRDRAAANLARGRFYNLLFILPDSEDEFVTTIEQKIRDFTRVQGGDRTRVHKIRVRSFDPKDVAGIIGRINPRHFHGVAVFGPETPSVRDAIDRLKRNGVAVVALVSDLPSSARDHFVGIDNTSAGKTAGKLMGRFLGVDRGKIVVLTGSRLARDHIERRLGFDTVMQREFPRFHVLPSIEAPEDPAQLRQLLTRVFAQDGICAVYSSTGDNRGLISFLENAGLGDRLTVIGHELTDVSRAALESGTFDAVISQDAGHLVRSSVRLLRAQIDAVPHDPWQELIRIDIFLKENMPRLADPDEAPGIEGPEDDL